MKKLAPLMLLLAFGCGDDDGRPITLMDTGTRDTGGGVDAGPMVDSGVDSGPMGTCTDPLPLLPATALPRCSATTLTCLMGCGADQPCQQGCIEGDTTPPIDGGGVQINCGVCLSLQITSCAADNGCGTQWGAWNCCLDACTADAMTCQSMCMAEGNTFIGCANGTGAACAAAQQSCFM